MIISFNLTVYDISIYKKINIGVINIHSKNASDIAMIEENEDHIGTIAQYSQTEIPSNNGSSFCAEEEIFFSEEEEIESENERPKGGVFIVYWSCLSILLHRSLISTAPAIITKIIAVGLALCINLLCQVNHKSVWRSKTMEKRFYLDNVRLSACVRLNARDYVFSN